MKYSINGAPLMFASQFIALVILFRELVGRKAIIWLTILFSCTTTLFAQSPECRSYERLLNEARTELAKGDDMDTEKVFNKLRSARTRSEACRQSTPSRNRFTELDDLQKQLFRHLDELKKDAQEAREEALARSEELTLEKQKLVNEKSRADSLRRVAEKQSALLGEQTIALGKEKALLEQAVIKAEMLQRRSDEVLDMIYFYQGRYGLANNGDAENPLYGFIDRDLNVLIDFNYVEALPFDESGYTRVMRGKEPLLIDTTDHKLRLAESPDQLRSNTQALDLRRMMSRNGNREGMIGKKLPKLIGEYRGLEIILANHGSLEDVSALASITRLKELQVSQNELEDIRPLGPLRQLRHLRLADNDIETPSVVTGLRSLVTLDLSGNEIESVQPFTGLLKLERLNLARNEIKRLNLQLNLPELSYLDLSRNRLIEVSGIGSLATLLELNLEYNNLNNLGPLNGLRQLKSLNLGNNKVNNISPLAGLLQLRSLTLVDNSISDISPLAELDQLRELDLSETKINSLKALFGLENLRLLKITKCRSLSEEAIVDFRAAQPGCLVVE